jgi:hypothetical protein
MNIKIGVMLVTIVLVISVATMTIVSNPSYAVKPTHPYNHGACVSQQAKQPGPNKDTAHSECTHLRP